MGTSLQQQVPLPLILGPAHPDHAYTLAPRLCEQDREHLTYSFEDGSPIEECIRCTVEWSEQCFTIHDADGVLEGLWGHGSWGRSSGVGFVWLLCSEDLWDKYLLSLTKIFRQFIVPSLDELYSAYGCEIMSKNLPLVRWLTRSGFRAATHSDDTGETFVCMMRGL